VQLPRRVSAAVAQAVASFHKQDGVVSCLDRCAARWLVPAQSLGAAPGAGKKRQIDWAARRCKSWKRVPSTLRSVQRLVRMPRCSGSAAALAITGGFYGGYRPPRMTCQGVQEFIQRELLPVAVQCTTPRTLPL